MRAKRKSTKKKKRQTAKKRKNLEAKKEASQEKGKPFQSPSDHKKSNHIKTK